MATNRGRVTPRPEVGTPSTAPSFGDQTSPGALICVTSAPRPSIYRNIPAVDQTTPAAMLCVMSAARPIPLS